MIYLSVYSLPPRQLKVVVAVDESAQAKFFKSQLTINFTITIIIVIIFFFFIILDSLEVGSISSSPAAYSYSHSHRGRLRKRKHVLSCRKWQNMFTSDGKLNDGGIQFLKHVRSGGVDPKIRAQVWPFLLGVYDLGSSKGEREIIRNEKRKEYGKLRRQCRRILNRVPDLFKAEEVSQFSDGQVNESETFIEESISLDSDDAIGAMESIFNEERYPQDDYADPAGSIMPDGDTSVVYDDSGSLETDSSDDPFTSQTFPSMEIQEGNDDTNIFHTVGSTPSETEDFATWQRIIRLDAIRANTEWMSYSPSQAAVQDDRARRYAESVGLKDYDHLEPCQIFHAARLVAILEAYALYDPEIGYCQGMSDLLSPIITVMTEDHEAFWCFVGFMKKARHNFRLDEEGIRRQLKIVSKIIKHKDSHLYKHLEKLQAEDCFFVYRMVMVLFRRELSFEQTTCLWEVIWADQAAIRASMGKSAWKQHAPPTEDLLLYAIAASVLQKRKLIIEKHNSLDEIVKECNSMTGHLDVWKLLDDAHSLVVTLHDKT